MPFCTNCGSKIDGRAAYCAQCGGRQPSSAPPHNPDFLSGVSDRTASILCYVPVLGVIPAIVFLASQRFRRNVQVRFNAFQSLYLFVAWLLISSAVPVLFFGGSGWGALVGMMKMALFICWIYLLVKAAHLEQVRLPILGDLAARSTMEQM